MAIDWTKSMQQTYEYRIVDPLTWLDSEKVLKNVLGSSIERDSSSDTKGSASVDLTETIEECYVRIYLIATQNGETVREPLATVLLQTPSTSYDGKVESISADGFTPLLELSEKPVPLGYFLEKNAPILSNASQLLRNYTRAPVIESSSSKNLVEAFVANEDDTWLTFLKDLVANDNNDIYVDELGQIFLMPYRETESLQYKWVYDTGNSSILYPDISIDHDIYGVPNVVEVVYTDSNRNYHSRAENRDNASPTSINRRGREIIKRVTNPLIFGDISQQSVDDYAKRALEEASTLTYTIKYKHGYCPVKLDDCVLLDYPEIGINRIKARVTAQSISCQTGCTVSETATFIAKLWELNKH